jgi:ATP-binding cassette subfamily B protein
MSVELTLLIFVLLPFMLIGTRYFRRKMRAAFKEARHQVGEINAQVEDSLLGIRVVKSFANEEVEKQKFKVGNDGFLESKRENYKLMAQYHSGLNGFTTLLNIVVVIVGALFITGNLMPAAELVTFLLYVGNIVEPIRKLVAFTEQYQNGMSGFERFMEIMNVHPDIEDEPDAVEAGQLKGKISFRDVSFRYENTLQDHSDDCKYYYDHQIVHIIPPQMSFATLRTQTCFTPSFLQPHYSTGS